MRHTAGRMRELIDPQCLARSPAFVARQASASCATRHAAPLQPHAKTTPGRQEPRTCGYVRSGSLSPGQRWSEGRGGRVAPKPGLERITCASSDIEYSSSPASVFSRRRLRIYAWGGGAVRLKLPPFVPNTKRTASIVIEADAAAFSALVDVQAAYTAACNLVVPIVIENRCWNRVALHNTAAYDWLRPPNAARFADGVQHLPHRLRRLCLDALQRGDQGRRAGPSETHRSTTTCAPSRCAATSCPCGR
jgi:hypothetical protein